MLYVGILNNSINREVFKDKDYPTEKKWKHKYGAVIGPFKTLRGANYMSDYGYNNPHLQHVDDAERLSKEAIQLKKYIGG